MKLISLNTWGGRYFKPLVDFIKQYSDDTDIFCFQEIYDTKSDVKQYKNIRANLLEELIKILPDFQYLYSKEIAGFDSNPDPVNFNLAVGKAMFVKQNIQISSKDDLLIFGDRSEKFLKKDFSNAPISFQYITFSTNNKSYIVCNIHGMSFPGSKLDTDLRLEHAV
ncbi:hypothetical protein M1307_03380, partial [Patescibacteria group bacterium]|nr:hypothetical protein [Patescibacteria group bacterium]